MNFNELRAFHAVATAGGFTAASKAQNIAQPSLSRHIRTLEERYQAELFYRRGRTVVLSPLGARLLELTQRMFVVADEAEQLLQNSAGVHEGRLNIGAVESHELARILAAFNNAFPRIELLVSIANSRELLRGLVDFKIDIAFLAQPDVDPRLSTFECGRHQVVVFVNKSHPWATRDSISIMELQNQPVVMRESGSMTRHAFEQALARRRVKVRTLMEMGSREMVWWAVRHASGIGFVSRREFIPHADLHLIEIEDEDVHYDLRAACMSGRRNSPLIRHFFGVLEDVMGDGMRDAATPLHQAIPA